MSGIGSPQYPQLNQTQSPIQTLGGVVEIQNAMNRNKLFQQQYQSNLGLGQIYKEAIDPQTGEIDPEKLRGLLAGPNAAGITLGLPQAIQNSQEAQKRNIDIDIAKVQQAQQHLSAVSGYLAPLIKDGSTSADVATALAHATTNGLAKPEVAAQIWSSLPRDAQGNIDESKIPAWAQQQQIQVMSAQERLNALSPPPQLVNTGQSQVPMRFPQSGHPSLAGPGIQNELPPTTQRYNPKTQQMEFIGPQSGGNSGTPAPASSGTGADQPGAIPAGPPLGAEVAASTTAKGGAEQGVALQQRADRAPDNKAILGNLEGELSNINTGPGTESVAKFNKFVNAQLGTNVNVKGLASREAFNKLAGMYAQSQFQALGGTGANAQLDATTLTSPNSELSKMGNKGIIALLKGNEDAIQAKNNFWQQYSQQHGSGSYGQFLTQFNKVYDPRVFQSQYLNGDDKKKMLSGMNDNEKQKFRSSYNTAVSLGWIPDPRGGGGQ